MSTQDPTSRKNNPTLYRKVFCDIVRGYSRSYLDDKLLFIKHLTTHDQVDLEDIEADFYRKAQKRGIPTEQEVTKTLREEDSWTEEDELSIEKQKFFLENLAKGKAQLMLKSQLDRQDEQIKEETKKLQSKLKEKEDLLGNTCEKYSRQRVNDYYISRSFFKDELLKKPMFSEEEFDEVTYSELSKLITLHNDQFSMFTEDVIQETILEEFYYSYMPFSEDTMQFFGLPVCLLTQNQLKLILFTRVFKGILDQHDNIPEHIRKNPKALLDFASASKRGNEELEKHEERGGATTLVGATKEDYEFMGVTPGKASGGVSLHEAAKKAGGTLSMDALMDITGTKEKS